MEGVVVKTVAGFLNSQGGILIVGVNDAGIPIGIDRDMETLNKKNLDGYELFLRSLLNTGIGVDMCARVEIEFAPIDGIRICVLRVPAAPRAVWVNSGSGKILYIRSGNSTQPLDSEAAHNYISSHFGMGI
jgi:predicted HTH transcriptional regulator